MTDTCLTEEARNLLNITIIDILTAKGVSLSVAERTSLDIINSFDGRVAKYMDQILLDRQLSIIRGALSGNH